MYVPPEEFEVLLTHVPDPRFRDLLVTSDQTGCRPKEWLRVIDDYVDQKNARSVFPSTKSKGKKAPRIIYLNDMAMEISNRLLDEFPGSELFRNVAGRPWKTETVNCAFDRIQIRMGKQILEKENRGPNEKEISNFIETLKPTKNVKGVKREKRRAELRCEAKRKLTERKAKEMTPRYSLYSLRHSWATNALKRGVDPLTVPLLMGHKDPSMLARVYQH